MKNKIILTFDLEEFDLPLEYQISIDKERQLDITTTGLRKIIELLRVHQIKATFFTTAFYAENNPFIIKELVNEGHEIASHLYYHSEIRPEHILESKQKLEEIINREVSGIRIPRFKTMSTKLIKEAGYIYDSSVNPTYLPGRYNNFFKPRTIYFDSTAGIYIFPLSVATMLRIPLFWISFKILNFYIYLFLCKLSLNKNKYLHLYFHPWEFTDLSNFEIPWYVKYKSGPQLVQRLDRFIQKLKKNAEFINALQFINGQTVFKVDQK